MNEYKSTGISPEFYKIRLQEYSSQIKHDNAQFKWNKYHTRK